MVMLSPVTYVHGGVEYRETSMEGMSVENVEDGGNSKQLIVRTCGVYSVSNIRKNKVSGE
jgi:hypothetical protein